MKLILEIDDMGVIRWLIDSSHQCHDDCKGQTGAGMMMGKGAGWEYRGDGGRNGITRNCGRFKASYNDGNNERRGREDK